MGRIGSSVTWSFNGLHGWGYDLNTEWKCVVFTLISCSDFDSQILFFADDEVMTQSLLGPD
jgi:hypothetical protein